MPPLTESTTRPVAKPLTDEQLQAELSKGAPSAPKSDAPADGAPSSDTTQRVEKSSVPNLMENIRKGVMEKKPDDGAPVEDKKPEVKKKDVVSADDASPKGKTDAPVELTEADLDVQPHDSARVRARILENNARRKKAEAERDTIKKELEEARKAPPTAANLEEVTKLKAEHQKLQDEATKLRRRYDWENDGEAKAKFREPVAAAEKAIEEAFTRSGFGAPTLAAIKEAGGFAAFSRSKTTYPIEVADADAEGGKKTIHVTAAELARSWVAKMPIADAQLINQSVGRQEMLQAEEKQAIQKAMDESKSYFENQTKAQREAQEAADANTKRLSTEYETWAKKTETDTEFLKDAEIPANASAEEKKAIEGRNAFAAELRAGLKTHPKTALEYGQLKLEAAESKHLKRVLAEREATITHLEEQVKKSKGALKTTGRGGSLLVKDGHKPDEEKKAPGDTNFMAAINRTMQKKAGGEDEE